MKINGKNQEKAKDLAREMFSRMGFSDLEVSCSAEAETMQLKVRCQEPKLLIGKRGRTLRAFQRLLRIILLKQLKPKFYLHLDINDYRKKKKKYLREVADEVADEVSLVQEEKPLPVMSAYERRIVHLALAERADVTTESEGEEPKRRVVVKPT